MNIKSYIKIFSTAFTQVGLIAINTVFITKGIVIGIFIVGFFISLLWCFNVAKVSVSLLSQKMTYAFGAGVGAVAGYYIVNLFV